MTAGRYIVSLDIGTSAAKCILIDDTGRILARHTEGCPCAYPRPGWVEQNPDDWWRAACRGLKAVLAAGAGATDSLTGAAVRPDEVAAVGLSAQMHGLVALDESLRVLRPAILWNDQRTQKECEEIHAAAGGWERLLDYTNNAMLPGYTGGKILWLRSHEPEVFERARYFLNPKDYIRLRLTGDMATDVSDASGTGLFDVEHRCWCKPLLKILNLDGRALPRVYESTEFTGAVSPSAGKDTGLKAGTPVSAGGGDSVIQTTGTGVLNRNRLMSTIGSAGVLAAGLEGFRRNAGPNLQIFCGSSPRHWHAMGVTLCAGAAYSWFSRVFGAEVSGFEALDRGVGDSPPGAKSLIFLPYLNGERCPYTDPAARGCFIGLNLSHGLGDLARAVMEGVIFSLRHVFEEMKPLVETESTESITEIRSSGGSMKSPIWRRIHADIFQLPVVTLKGAEEGGAFGAALAAGVGAGIWESLEDSFGVLKPASRTEPSPENRGLYDDLFECYRGLYPCLKDEFKRLDGYSGG